MIWWVFFVFFLPKVVPAFWLGVDVHLCWFLHLPLFFLRPPFPLCLHPSSLQAGGGRWTVDWFLQTSGPPGECHRKLLWNFECGPGSLQRSASAGAEGRGEQVWVPEGRDAVEGIWGFRRRLPPLSVLSAAGRRNCSVRSISEPRWGLGCPSEDPLLVLCSPAGALDLSAILPLSLLPSVSYPVAGGSFRLPELEGVVPGLVSPGAQLVLSWEARSGAH